MKVKHEGKELIWIINAKQGEEFKDGSVSILPRDLSHLTRTQVLSICDDLQEIARQLRA